MTHYINYIGGTGVGKSTRDYSNLIERKHDYNLIGRKKDVEMAKRVDKIIEDILFSMGLEPSKLKQVNLKRSNI